MAYTVHQLAKLADISPRTLHFYDEIGLLKPAFVRSNGYRCYEDKELLKLQQILFFRELEFPLSQIKQMFEAPDFHPLAVLQDQKKLIEMKKERLEKLLLTIINTIKSMKKGKKPKAQELYGSFTKEQMEQYKEEVKQKYGHTKAYQQSEERTKNWKKKDYDRVQKEGGAILNAIVQLMDRGIEDQEVQQKIHEYRQHIGNFYDCTHEIFRGLGKLYLEDERFTEFFRKIHQDLPEFISKAIAYYCDHNEK
jgi:DNA-binding transcriptional MerR regulator